MQNKKILKEKNCLIFVLRTNKISPLSLVKRNNLQIQAMLTTLWRLEDNQSKSAAPSNSARDKSSRTRSIKQCKFVVIRRLSREPSEIFNFHKVHIRGESQNHVLRLTRCLNWMWDEMLIETSRWVALEFMYLCFKETSMWKKGLSPILWTFLINGLLKKVQKEKNNIALHWYLSHYLN